MDYYKKIECGILNSYYGALLTGHQSELIKMYYDCDMSLSEIGEQFNITRQGAHEIITRATLKLYQYEDKLKLVSKISSIQSYLQSLITDTTELEQKELLQGVISLLREI